MSTDLAPRAPRGFSLIELAVSLVVTAILTAGALALLTQQQRALQTTSADRALQETVRTALADLGTNLRRAGFGIEPFRAFDFTTCSGTAVECRDSIAGSDEIMFYARDPGFKATLSQTPSASQLVIAGGLQTPLSPGQILQVMCPSASQWTYVTVGRSVARNWTPPAAPPATTTIPLLAGTGAFPQQNADLEATGSCFQTMSSMTRVYRVDRFRYFVQSFPDPDTGAIRPYLMLDRGLADGTGATVAEPVAPDVEDIQFEYEFVNASTGAVRVVGDLAGTRLSNAATSIDLAAAPPSYDDRSNDPTRATNHPANIRAVRVHVVARTPVADMTKQRDLVQLAYAEGGQLLAAGNRPTVPAATGYVRIRVETTEATRNLESRSPYYDP